MVEDLVDVPLVLVGLCVEEWTEEVLVEDGRTVDFGCGGGTLGSPGFVSVVSKLPSQ